MTRLQDVDDAKIDHDILRRRACRGLAGRQRGGGHVHAQAHARQAQLVAERIRARNHQAARPPLPARTGPT